MKSVKFSYIYDFAFDLVDFSCEGEFRFKRSVELGEGIFLDFDENDLPVSLELIGASKILGVHRKHLNNPKFKVHVMISENSIKTEISMKYLIHQGQFEAKVEKEVSNDWLLDSIEMVMIN